MRIPIAIVLAELVACGGGSTPAGGVSPDAPGQSVPDAPGQSAPDGPGQSVPDAPGQSVPDAPVQSVPDAAGNGGPAGTPVGAAITKTIGAAGGQIATSDGAFTLSIPAGALAADTSISVQPVTRTAAGGFGPGYRLGPEGQTFVHPVTLTFNLAGAEGLDIASATVATQPSTGGAWTAVASQRDLGAGTVTATTPHFSDFTVISTVVIDPTSASLDYGQMVTFTAVFCAPSEPGTNVGDCGTPAGTVAWSANGVANGDATQGLITGIDSKGYYMAPASAPPTNPVKVTVAVMNPGGGGASASARVRVGLSWGGGVSVTVVDTSTPGVTLTIKSAASVSFRKLPGSSMYTPNGNVSVMEDLVNSTQGCTGHAEGGASIFDNDGTLAFIPFGGQTYYQGFGYLMINATLTGTDDCTSDHHIEDFNPGLSLYPWWPPIMPMTGVPGYLIKNGGTEMQEDVMSNTAATTAEVSWDLKAGQ